MDLEGNEKVHELGLRAVVFKMGMEFDFNSFKNRSDELSRLQKLSLSARREDLVPEVLDF